jgi:hypothetical protein
VPDRARVELFLEPGQPPARELPGVVQDVLAPVDRPLVAGVLLMLGTRADGEEDPS